MSDIAGGDPRNTAKHKFAVAAVIILSTLIVLALIALVVGGIMQIGGKGRAAASSAAALALPPGSHILSSETQPGRLILHVRTPKGEEIDIVDINSGRLVSRIQASGNP